MALRPRMSNTPKLDDKGFCMNGQLEDINYFTEEESEFERAGFTFSFGCDGSQKRLLLKVFTGDSIRATKDKVDGKKEDYNKLTKICLKMGLFSEKELKDLTDTPDLDSLIGASVKFKLKKDKFLSRVDLDSLTPLKS